MSEPDIHVLRLPTPFEVGALNAYLVLGDVPTLVDTGVNSEEAWSALEAGLAVHGLGVSDLGRVVLTHGHVDHYGQAARIQKLSKAEVVAHPRTVPLVAAFPWEDERVVANTLDFFTRHGVPEDVSKRAVDQLASGSPLQEPVEVDRTFEHGEELDLGPGHRFRVYEVAGHLPGHVVLHHEASRTLITGDQLLVDAPTVPFLYLVDWHEGLRPSSLNLYLLSLFHLGRLDVARVLPAHGSFDISHVERIEQIQRRYARVQRRMRSVLRSSGEMSAWQLGRRLYRGHAEGAPFLVMSEIIGSVDYLERSGEVEQVERADGSFGLRLTELGRRDDDGDLPKRLRIDREGRWYHDGEELLHARTLALFARSLTKDDRGRFVVQSGHERMAVDVEDAPCLVRSVEVVPPGGFRLDLGHGLQADLDLDSLVVGEENVLYTELESGLEARFARSAYYQMAQYIQEDGNGGFDVVTPDGRRHPVGRREGRDGT